MKTCPKCKQTKPSTNEYFYKYSKSPSGLHSWCKLCNNQRGRDYYKNNPEKINQQAKQWKLDNPEKSNQHARHWQTKKQGIYEWFEGDTTLYVGQSKQLNNRISNHRTYFNNPELSKKETQASLYDSLRQHQNPQIRIVEECSVDKLLEREQYYINKLKPLYNDQLN